MIGNESVKEMLLRFMNKCKHNIEYYEDENKEILQKVKENNDSIKLEEREIAKYKEVISKL